MEIGLFIAPQQVGATYDEQLRVALAAEAAGFASFVRSEHVMANPGMDPGAGPTDAWITLAGLARETHTIRLGTMVSPVTFRHPGMLAIAVAQVDAMSDGRVLLGLGAGWFEDEHVAYGIPFPPASERFERLDEQLSILRGIWSTPPGDLFDFTGRWYNLRGCPALPRPAQVPHPPIVVGGSGHRRTTAMAARHADELNASPPGTPEATARFFDAGRVACESAGRDPAGLRRSVTLTTVCGTDAADVERRTGAARGYTDVAGTPLQVVEQLLSYREAGAQAAYLRLVDVRDLEQLALIGSEVLPQLQT